MGAATLTMVATEPAGRPGTERESHVMNMDFGGWSATGILAALAIVAGSVLLVVYAVRRGLVNRDLDGTIAAEGPDGTMPAAAGGAAAPSRALGVAGVIVLVVGLGLGLIAVATGPGAGGPGATGPGTGPTDCAASWAGCPQATPRP